MRRSDGNIYLEEGKEHRVKRSPSFYYLHYCFPFFIERWLVYNTVLVSGVQRSDSVIRTYIYSFSDYFPL